MTAKPKIPIQLINPEAKEIWEAVLRAKAEVDTWPAWKRGGEPASASAGGAPASEAHPTPPAPQRED